MIICVELLIRLTIKHEITFIFSISRNH